MRFFPPVLCFVGPCNCIVELDFVTACESGRVSVVVTVVVEVEVVVDVFCVLFLPLKSKDPTTGAEETSLFFLT